MPNQNRNRYRSQVQGATGPQPPPAGFRPLFRNTRWPAVPDPTHSKESLEQTVAALKARTHIQSREKGDYFDSFVSVRDLIALGLLTYDGRMAPDNYVGWETIRVASQTIALPGAGTDPGRESTSGCLLFDASTAELVYLYVEMPHSWVEGTYLVPYVNWQKTTSAAGDVDWQLRYKGVGLDDVMSGGWTSLGGVHNVGEGTTDTNTAGQTLCSSFGQFDTNGYGIRDGFLFELSRDATQGTDTYAADARLLGFGLRYQADSYGSLQQLSKTRDY